MAVRRDLFSKLAILLSSALFRRRCEGP